jgi:hypothetical protein
MELKLNLSEPRIRQKVTNDRFGLFVSNEWKRLIDPYTPRDTGVLMGITGQTVDVKPFSLVYKSKYATAVYYGYHMNFQKKNPYSTYEWDIKAEEAGQKDKLYRVLNNGLQSGRF